MTNRIFQNTKLNTNQNIRLDLSASHHLINVLRLQINDKFIIFNGSGGSYSAKITNLTKKHAEVKIEKYLANDVEPSIHIDLAQGISQSTKMDFCIQKSVELGVKSIIPLITEKCKISHNQNHLKKKHQHWQKIIIQSCEQCGRNKLPSINTPTNINSWFNELKQIKKNQLKIILDPKAKNSLHSVIKNKTEVKNIIILIGPEAGFTQDEINLAQKFDFNLVSLGPRILRTETTSLSIISILQYLYGDFS